MTSIIIQVRKWIWKILVHNKLMYQGDITPGNGDMTLQRYYDSRAQCVISLELLTSWAGLVLLSWHPRHSPWMRRWTNNPFPRRSFHLKNSRGKNFKTISEVSLETHVRHRSTSRGRYLAGNLATDKAVICFSWIPQNSYGAGMALLWHTLLCSYLPLSSPTPLQALLLPQFILQIWSEAQEIFLPESLIDEGSKGAGMPRFLLRQLSCLSTYCKSTGLQWRRERLKCNS